MIRQDRCDFAIVGGGAAGSVVASRLAAAFPGADITLIEAGSARSGLINRIPLLSGYAPFRSGTNWMHAAAGPGGGQLLFQGRMVGGSSELNGMIISEGEPDDYASWETAAGPGWGWPECRAALESLSDGRAGGTIHRSPTESYGPLPRAFLEAAAEAGFPVVSDLNAATGQRFGPTHANIRHGRRHSAPMAFLQPRPANLRILTATRAMRIECAGGRATAIELADPFGPIRLGVARETVLCCGAIGTAALLLRSGIGPEAELIRAGITPALDHAELGHNLQNHPSWPMRIPTRGGSLAGLLRSPWRGGAAALRWLRAGRGPLAQPVFQAAGYFRPRAAEIPGMAQVIFSPALFASAPPGRAPALPLRHGVSLAIQQGSPLSHGRVWLGPDQQLQIRTGAFDDPRDGLFVQSAIDTILALLARPAFARFIRGALPRLPSVAEIRTGAGTAFHMAGTARMGRDAGAVTDPQLRLRGLAGLRIADASVMPRLPNAALHFPTMMIAARAADFIREDH